MVIPAFSPYLSAIRKSDMYEPTLYSYTLLCCQYISAAQSNTTADFNEFNITGTDAYFTHLM